MSGVRNLRAMFEQRGENNPPDRGRSPGPGGFASTPSPSHSPRRLSKVRTTFVAVEKDGRVGLVREHSGDSVSVSSRRLSDDTEATTPQPTSEKTDVFAENMAKNASALKTNLSQEAIPESPIQSAPSKPTPKESRSPNIAPNPNPDKVTDEEETKTRLLPGNPTDKAATRGKSVTPTPATSASTNGKPKTAVSKPASKTVHKPAPVSTTGRSVSKPAKSPTKAISNSAKPTRAASLGPQKKPTPAASKDHDAPKKTTVPAAAKAAVTSGKKPAPIDLPPSGTGFVKPKPKSPTRPIKLPSSLTAPTAAYASKLGGGSAAQPPRQSLSRASGTAAYLGVAPAINRSPSRSSLASAGVDAKGLKRQSSTVSRSRPSIGPPPKQPAKDHPVSKKEAHVDESFLARMMRPTQSSSSKTSEKAPVTPPRKASSPMTSNKKSATKDNEASAKKMAAKIQASSNSLQAAVDSVNPVERETPAAKEVAPIVAQTETAEAAIDTAKVSAETVATPVLEEAKEVIAEPAVVVESEETKEEVVEESPEPAATVPVIVEDAEKVADIEDLVQEAIEEPVAQSPAEPVIEVSVADSEEPKEAEDVQAVPETTEEAIPAESEPVSVAIEEPEVEEPKAEEPEVTAVEATNAEESKEEETKVENVKEDEVKPEGLSDA